MKKFTFRTECSFDNNKVPELLKILGVKLINEQQLIDQFTFESDASLHKLKSTMATIINSSETFVDMHRCHQTLSLGLEPDENWYS